MTEAAASWGGFPREEFETRNLRVQAEIDARGLDALVVTNPANITYLTASPAKESAYVPQAALVVRGCALPVLVMRPADANGARLTSWLPRGDVLTYPEDYIGHPTSSGYDFIRERLHDLTGPRARIGLEHDSLSGCALETLRRDGGGRHWTDTTTLINALRVRKSAREIDVMRQAALISDYAMQVAAEAIRPGRCEAHAAAEIMAAVCRGTDAYPGDLPERPMMPAGPRTGAAHLSWTEHPYVRGQHVNVELGGCRYRYSVGLSRSIHVGEPSAEFRRMHAIAVEGLEAAIDAARPGNTCEAVALAFNRVIEPHGLAKPSRCGYPMGIEWMDGTVVGSLKIGERMPLAERMVYHLMLGIWLRDDWGFVISETVVIERDGARSLSSFGREVLGGD